MIRHTKLSFTLLTIFLLSACSQTGTMTVGEPMVIFDSRSSVEIPPFFSANVLERFTDARGDDAYAPLPNAFLRIYDQDYLYDDRSFSANSAGQVIIPSSLLNFNQEYIIEVQNSEGATGSFSFFYDDEFLQNYNLQEVISVVIGQDITMDVDISGPRGTGIIFGDPRGARIEN